MRARFFILFFFILSIKGFAQEINITLYPDEELTTKVNEFPVILNWDRKDNQIRIQLKGNGDKNKFIYFFREIRLFKEIREQDKNIYFSEEIEKISDRNLVQKFSDNKLNKNCIYKKGPEVEKRGSEIEYASLGSNTIGEFRFAVIDLTEGHCKITIRAYIALSKKKPGLFTRRNRKVVSMETFVFNVSLFGSLCETPESKTMVDAINEKTKELKKLEAEIDRFLEKDCSKVPELKNNAGQYREQQVKSKYAGCETVKQALEENEKIYQTVQSKRCNGTPPPSPINCELIFKKLDNANAKLGMLFLQIRSQKGNLTAIRGEYESVKKEVNSVYTPAYNERCREKEYKDAYNAYKNWCKSIDNELLK